MLQHKGPDPQVGEVSITMPMDELPTASSKVKTKQGRYKDDDIESSDSESDAPTVQHFNVSVSTNVFLIISPTRRPHGERDGCLSQACTHTMSRTHIVLLFESHAVSFQEDVP